MPGYHGEMVQALVQPVAFCEVFSCQKALMDDDWDDPLLKCPRPLLPSLHLKAAVCQAMCVEHSHHRLNICVPQFLC